ncbi:MAG: hypothetical protein F6K50_11910 [Moorea sp. SIO3I7]|nr:hypothetical protein [Moorena sp. SIO3I8]NEN96211.1 hypothetical protein [Moorena sp. SIO3I7]NEO06134.1 hypothetical protein [Moorena sp. SIO3I8]
MLEFCDWPLGHATRLAVGHATRTHPPLLPDIGHGRCYNSWNYQQDWYVQ